jgi:hypothetical protein
VRKERSRADVELISAVVHRQPADAARLVANLVSSPSSCKSAPFLYVSGRLGLTHPQQPATTFRSPATLRAVPPAAPRADDFYVRKETIFHSRGRNAFLFIVLVERSNTGSNRGLQVSVRLTCVVFGLHFVTPRRHSNEPTEGPISPLAPPPPLSTACNCSCALHVARIFATNESACGLRRQGRSACPRACASHAPS